MALAGRGPGQGAQDPPAPAPDQPPTPARALGLVIGVIALAHLPLLLGQVYFYRDVGRWLYPARVFLRQALAAGESPLYSPAQGLGLGLAASPLYGVFYPTSWLPGFGAEARALSLIVFLHLVWGAAGMLALAARFGLSRPAAVVAGLGWGLSGPITAAITAGQLMPASSWFPWCALGAIALCARLDGSKRQLYAGVAWAALAPAAALLLGEIFQAALASAFGGAIALVWSRWQTRSRGAAGKPDLETTGRSRMRAVGVAVLATLAALALAGALAAVMLLPLGRALGETERGGGLAREVAEKWSLHPLRLVELIAPAAMGDAYGAYPGGRWAGDGATDDRPLLYGVYLGASLVLLALGGLGGHRSSAGLGALALLAVLLALGRHTPVHAFLRTLVPLFAYQRAPEKFILAAAPALALLAGLGTQRALGNPRVLLRPSVLVGGLLALVQLGPLLWPEQRVAGTIAAGARHGLVAVAGLLVAAWLPRRALGARWPRLGAALLPAVVALDLGLAALPLLVFAPASILDETPALAQLARNGWRGPGRPRVVRDPSVEAVLVGLSRGHGLVHLEALRYATLRPGFLTGHGLATLPGYDAGLPPALERLWQKGQDRALSLMRLLAVDFVVLPVPAGGASPPGLALVGTPGPPGVGLYRVLDPLPRVFVAGRAERFDDAQGLAPAAASRLLADDVAAGATVLLAADAPPSGTGAARGVPCTVRAYAHVHIEAICESAAAGHAVFVEQHGAGWTAAVDGAPAAILRANGLMRAVPLPAGRHQIVLRYTQPGLRAGATLSVVALLAVVAALAIGRRGGGRNLGKLPPT